MDATCRKAVRPALVRGRHDRMTCRARLGRLLEHPQQAARPIGEPVRLSAPVALRGEADERRVRGRRDRQRAGDGVEQDVARGARQIDRLRRPAVRWGCGSTQKELPARTRAQQREDDVVPRVEVVRDDQQLAESRLAKVVG
jgi:hypothetical protein